jgi:predicted dienelactone hydrolase
MKLRPVLWLSLLTVAPRVWAQNPEPKLAASFALQTQKLEWHDAARQRAVPVTLHFPATGAGPFPLLIISHGLGSNRDGLNFIGQFYARNGYICAQIQHIDSDDSLWRGAANPLAALAKAAGSQDAINNRPLDARFAIDQMITLNGDANSPLFGRIDTQNIGIAGHSFGAFTAQAVAGRGSAQKPEWSDARVKACVAMSAPSGTPETIRPQFAGFKVPFFFLTGTEDNIPFVTPETTPETRRAAFEAITGVDGYYLLLKDADHLSFAGQRLFGEAPSDARDHDLIRASTLLFFDAYLKNSATAKRELRDGGFARQLGENGTLEVK